MSAWLLKKKSGSSMVRMRQYNKRYFTIDFDSHVFFYSHAESSKKVSSVIRFADIVDVRMPDPLEGRKSEKGPAENKGSMLRRSFSFGSNSGSKEKEEQAHHFVILDVRPEKTMELLCSSALEATQWFQALKEAMVFGKDDTDEVAMCFGGTSGDEGETSELRPAPEPVAAPVGKAIAGFTDSGGYPTPAAQATAKPPLAPVALAGGQAVASTAATPLLAARADPPEDAPPKTKPDKPEKPAKALQEPAAAPVPVPVTAAPELSSAPSTAPASAPETAANEADTQAESEPVTASSAKVPLKAAPVDDEEDDDAPRKPKGTFLDLSLEEGAVEDAGSDSGAGPSSATKRAAAAKIAEDEIVETKGSIMQASDFGFAVDEDTESSGSAVSTPRAKDKTAFAGPGGLGDMPDSDQGSPSPGRTPAKLSEGGTPSRPEGPAIAEAGSRSYGDRHEGLSMQERLANLEFSDCESDDDDPLGLGAAKGGAR